MATAYQHTACRVRVQALLALRDRPFSETAGQARQGPTPDASAVAQGRWQVEPSLL